VPATDVDPARHVEAAHDVETADDVETARDAATGDGGQDDADADLAPAPAAGDVVPGIAAPGTAGPDVDEQAGPLTPPDGLPVMRHPATQPAAVTAEAEPPTVVTHAATEAAAETAEPVPAAPPTRPSIRYAGSGPARRVKPVTAEPDPEPAAAAAPAGSGDYWEGADGSQYAGLVYAAREESAGGSDDTEAGEPARRRPAPEIDEDAPPFATAPFAPVPRLNRVRSTPAPPADDDDEDE
jgi:dynein heavy chain